jgi:large subunit ribosomal protein L2
MELKKFRPITPGQRHKVAVTFDDITTSKHEKSLLAKN